jgi:AhpC/TSA family/Disulphide bond corrector protein DsbC
LQASAPDLKKRGIGLAAISYDPPATLKTFADARGITFPLLSDAGSATIKRYNLLNVEATGRTAGIPYPGTFILNARGIVTSRSFEPSYQERVSASSLLGVGQGTAKTETAHLVVTTASSDARVAPGTRLSLFVDIAPKSKMHVYAPEQKDVIPVSLQIDAGEVKAHAPVFPKPEKYFFKPLKETQLVYSKPFRLVQDITVALTPAIRERARSESSTIAVAGTLQYQACDDSICYMPVTVPLTWTLALTPLSR